MKDTPAITIIPSAPKKNHGGMRMWPSLESATRAYDIAGIVFLISLVVGVLATGIILWMGSVKESHWEQEKRDSSERISANEAKTARAIADSDIAKKASDEANERSAALELKSNETALALEKARIELLRLQEKLAWRTLGENRAKFVEDMKKFSGTALDIVVYPTGTSDIGPLQNEVTLALGDAGWTVRRWNMMGTEFVVGVGIALAPNETDKTKSIANALALLLNNAGILTWRINDLPDRSFPVPAVGPPPVGEIAPIRMLIGTKPE